jgi:hypothetical protein
VCQRIFGVVVRASNERNYKVRFENDTEQVCFSTSLRVESHNLGVTLEEVMRSLPTTQQEEAQGVIEDAAEGEENDLLDISMGIDDDALPADCNIESDQYDDLFGHQEEYLKHLRGRSSSPINNLWLNTPEENSSAAVTVADDSVDIATNEQTDFNNPSATEESAVPAEDAEEDDSPIVENTGLNTGGDTAEGTSHVKKIRHWK